MRTVITAQELADHKMMCDNHTVDSANATAAVAAMVEKIKETQSLGEAQKQIKEVLDTNPGQLRGMMRVALELIAAHEILQAERVARYEGSS
jgi:hypothetical protein